MTQNTESSLRKNMVQVSSLPAAAPGVRRRGTPVAITDHQCGPCGSESESSLSFNSIIVT